MAGRMFDRQMKNNPANNPYNHSNVPMSKLDIPMFDARTLGGG